MNYEIITPNDRDLFFNINIHTLDSKKNRKIVHKIRILLEGLKDMSK